MFEVGKATPRLKRLVAVLMACRSRVDSWFDDHREELLMVEVDPQGEGKYIEYP